MNQPTYAIHPAIGIARLGNSPAEFYLAPEATGALPTDCDTGGNPARDASGAEQPVGSFKDEQLRIKRQAARFRIFVYDDANPQGRELKIGDPIQGLESAGTLADIEWTVYLANKKAIWYEFQQLDGEYGYDAAHPRRNAAITQADQRRQLIIDPGPQTVNCTSQRAASFAQGQNPGYTQTFPPPLQPSSISTLGQILTNADNHLLVLGGFGNSGSYLSGPGGPYITDYANNDGWFDDVSDGPVMAILKYYSEEDQEYRYLNVQAPAWVVVGYPRYAPEIVDMITMDEVLYDLSVREFAYNTYMYGTGPFDAPAPVDPSDPDALWRWRAADKRWNPNYYPYFYKEIWPILSRPDRMQWVSNFLAISSDPHETGAGGNFELARIATPPTCKNTPECAGRCDGDCADDPYQAMRQYIYDMLRRPGEENWLSDPYKPERSDGKALMPLLCGDNPLSNTATTKFLRLTDTQLFLIRQWAAGKFINEQQESIADGQAEQPARKGADLDRGALGNVLGGAFCPGGELGWIMRNPQIYAAPYRLKAHPDFVPSAASGRAGGSGPFAPPALNLSDHLEIGLEPGDLTKHMSVPWQADFNECSTQDIDVSYEKWAKLPASQAKLAPGAMQTNPTLWWPSHRPMQVYRRLPLAPDQPARYQQVEWARGIPQTNQGDLKMVSAWQGLGFVVKNDDTSDGAPAFIEDEANDGM